MIERRGVRTCRHCGGDIVWTVFLRKETTEGLSVKAKCPYCGEVHKWIEWAGK